MYIHNQCRHSKNKVNQLSSREEEIVELLAKGLTQKEIAYHLKISDRTVATYVTRLLIKLKAKNSTNAVSTYVKTKYIKNIGTELISKFMKVLQEQLAGYERGAE